MHSAISSRPEYVREQVKEHDFGVVSVPLKRWERFYGQSAVRKIFILMVLAGIWQAYAIYLDNTLLLPTFTDTLRKFGELIVTGELPRKAWNSIKVLVQGYLAGVGLALGLTVLAVTSRIGNDLLETLTSMFNPLPAIALLPLALIWFGLGTPSLVFVLIHAVLWPVALNTHSGFLGVSSTLRMVGRNYGLRGLPYVFRILVPAAFPSILAG